MSAFGGISARRGWAQAFCGGFLLRGVPSDLPGTPHSSKGERRPPLRGDVPEPGGCERRMRRSREVRGAEGDIVWVCSGGGGTAARMDFYERRGAWGDCDGTACGVTGRVA
ncbi:hypothetical protein Raf01_71640 [Rugosimonospora africana]|uniref:Uncharacterized protein n=1 Tax=Rugosimonospora africana TaxID=556532 RepID=A0A8J3QZN0_9ACTN|nr:hypothetical protein Raf01_71640 [Rugosimonospora africana]